MRLDSLLPSLLLIAAVACGGDDDGGPDDGAGDDDGAAADAGRPDGGEDTDAGLGDAAPDLDGGGTGADCGGLLSLECDANHFCDWTPDSCGAGDKGGTCMPRPSECDPGRPPVCGCDGMRYDSACEAQRAGVDIPEVSICGP